MTIWYIIWAIVRTSATREVGLGWVPLLEQVAQIMAWAAGHGLPVLEASRVQLEIYRSSMEERGLAASTIDRRLSTACGFYRFAHIDGRISSNPAQYVRRPTVHPSQRRGLDRIGRR